MFMYVDAYTSFQLNQLIPTHKRIDRCKREREKPYRANAEESSGRYVVKGRIHDAMGI